MSKLAGGPSEKLDVAADRLAMVDRVRAFDWVATPLGPMESWPEALRVAVDICLSSRFPMFVWWGPELINIYNDGYVPMLGKRHPAALGRPARDSWDDIWSVVGPQADAVMQRGEATWNERVKLVMERKGYPEDTYFTWSYSPIRDASGKIGGLFCAVTEETERVRAEAALRNSESRYEQQSRLFERVASSTPDFIYAFDLDGRFVYANRRLLEVWGRTFEDAVGRNLYELGYPQWHAEMHMRELRQVIETKQAIKGEVPFTGGSGISGVYEYIFTPVVGPDGAVEVIAGTTRDVTERKRAEDDRRRHSAERESLLASERAARAEAERASEAKSEFLATLSHELRTPLTPVLLTVALLESNPHLPDDVRADIQTIRRNVELESRLISDLLDLTRISKGKLQLEMRDVDLHLVVRAAADIFQREASAKLVLDLRAAHHIVHSDSTRLQQVFWNLINNAIKFTPRDGTITVRSRNDDGRVCIDVIDTGAGIDPAVLPRLFNAFEQGEVRAARQQAGLGLGLAISRKLAEAHGGTITARSEGRGRGATFTVDLPVVAQSIHVSVSPTPVKSATHM